MNSLANADTDTIVVTKCQDMLSLERRVVVSVADRDVPYEEFSVAWQEFLENLFMWSRCTTQLIIVDVPRDHSRDLGSDYDNKNNENDRPADQPDPGV
jgi:hypothetical protein